MGKILFIAVDPADADCLTACACEARTYIHSCNAERKGHDVLVYENDIKDVDFKALDEFNPDIICLSIHTDLKIIEWAKSQKLWLPVVQMVLLLLIMPESICRKILISILYLPIICLFMAGQSCWIT